MCNSRESKYRFKAALSVQRADMKQGQSGPAFHLFFFFFSWAWEKQGLWFFFLQKVYFPSVGSFPSSPLLSPYPLSSALNGNKGPSAFCISTTILFCWEWVLGDTMGEVQLHRLEGVDGIWGILFSTMFLRVEYHWCLLVHLRTLLFWIFPPISPAIACHDVLWL